MIAKMSGSEKVGRAILEIPGRSTLTPWTHSIGGALCNQQVPTCTRIEGYQYGESHCANAVGYRMYMSVVSGALLNLAIENEYMRKAVF